MEITVVKTNAKTTSVQPASEAIEWALGPGSVTWRVMKDPTVFIVGLLREAMLLTLHPAFAAAAVDHDSFGDDPVMRFKHVAWYTYAATYGTPDDAEHVSGIVRRRHSTIVGVEPLTQLPYRANSEYELALTQAMLSASFLATYELLHGELTSSQRDQFCREQKVPAALLGTNPDHLPSTYGELIDTSPTPATASPLACRRETLSPFGNGEYPAGTVIGDLRPLFRRPTLFVLRAFADMAMLTMSWEERELISINRRPKLGSRRATHMALRLLSRWFRGDQGRAASTSSSASTSPRSTVGESLPTRSPGAALAPRSFRFPIPARISCTSTTSPATGRVRPSSTSSAARDVSPRSRPCRRHCEAPRHRRDDSLVDAVGSDVRVVRAIHGERGTAGRATGGPACGKEVQPLVLIRNRPAPYEQLGLDHCSRWNPQQARTDLGSSARRTRAVVVADIGSPVIPRLEPSPLRGYQKLEHTMPAIRVAVWCDGAGR